MLKIDERTLPTSCWNKAKDDEYVFTLLGRDKAFSETIRFWIDQRIKLGLNKSEDEQIQKTLILAAIVEKQQNAQSKSS